VDAKHRTFLILPVPTQQNMLMITSYSKLHFHSTKLSKKKYEILYKLYAFLQIYDSTQWPQCKICICAY